MKSESGLFQLDGKSYQYVSEYDGSRWLGRLVNYPELVMSIAIEEKYIVNNFKEDLKEYLRDTCKNFNFFVHYVKDGYASVGIAEFAIQTHHSEVMAIRAKEQRLPSFDEINRWGVELDGTVLNYHPLPC